MTYTFFHFLIQCVSIVKSVYNFNFKNALTESKDLCMNLKNYYYYNGMKYLNNQYLAGVYRLHSTDYNIVNYVPNLDDLPFGNLKIGTTPLNIYTYNLTLYKYLWRDFFYSFGDNPSVFFIFYTLWSVFPTLFVLCLLIFGIYKISSFFD